MKRSYCFCDEAVVMLLLGVGHGNTIPTLAERAIASMDDAGEVFTIDLLHKPPALNGGAV
jgi:hypothetical protein